MHYLTRVLLIGTASLASMSWSPAAVAEDVVAAATPPPTAELSSPAPVVTTEPLPSAAAVPRLNPLGAKPLDGDSLARKRGGSDTFSDMRLRGVVAGNQATNVTTGGNVISDGALAGATGLPMVIQNSGNNVLIQNATIVNVQMK
jgi:hypothetical protein